MNRISKGEKAVTILGVPGRAFGVVQADDGRILNQRIKARREYTEGTNRYSITVELRFDDQCNNDHETFAITADVRENGREYMGGCCHELIAEKFPEFAPLIKWHLFSTDEPMHYIANTTFHALEHDPTHAWVYFTGDSDPLNIGGTKERLVGYEKASKASDAEGKPGYRVQWDEKTTKTANFDHARSTAIWPDATPEQLRDKAQLAARLPALMAEFKAAMIGAGFVYPQARQEKAAQQ